jgi:hypothetical protein
MAVAAELEDTHQDYRVLRVLRNLREMEGAMVTRELRRLAVGLAMRLLAQKAAAVVAGLINIVGLRYLIWVQLKA